MAVKPDKSRIMFTTDSSFEYFLREMCLKENRNMSNLVDTILKNHYKDEYEKYLSYINESINEMLNSYGSECIVSDFKDLLNNPNVLFSEKIKILNEIAYSNEDVENVISRLHKELRKTLGLKPYMTNLDDIIDEINSR